MRKMKKLAAIALIAAIGTTVLTGCSSQEDNSANNPTKSNQNDYSESYVQLKDGRVVLCLFQDERTYAATMSCDFDHPIKK